MSELNEKMEVDNTKAIFPGSFDPYHWGHSWIIHEGKKLFKDFTVLVSQNNNKGINLSLEKRLEVIKRCEGNIKIHTLPHDQFLLDYCRENNIKYIIRGCRNEDDFKFEQALSKFNERNNPYWIQVVLLIPPSSYEYISSSLIKSTIHLQNHDKYIGTMLPSDSYKAVKELFHVV